MCTPKLLLPFCTPNSNLYLHTYLSNSPLPTCPYISSWLTYIFHISFCLHQRIRRYRASRSTHSGNNGSSGSLPSSAGGGPSLNSSDDINNADHLLNNNNMTMDNVTELCEVPDDVADQKRHVSDIYFLCYNMGNAQTDVHVINTHTQHTNLWQYRGCEIYWYKCCVCVCVIVQKRCGCTSSWVTFMAEILKAK